MAIEKKLIHFGKLADFEAQLTAGNILDYSIVFIQDAKKIWTHGAYYDCSEGTDVPDSVYVTDFTVNDLLDLVENPDSELSADFQSLYEAFAMHKVVLVPYDTSEGYAGYGIANGYHEDMLYFSVKIEGGRCIESEVNDGDQLSGRDVYMATYVPGESLKTINGLSLIGAGDITVGGEDNVQSDWNVTDSSSDAYIKNKPTIATKVSELTNDAGFIDSDAADERYIQADTAGDSVYAHVNGLADSQMAYALPTSANGDEDDVLLSRNTVKTINGESVYGSGDIEVALQSDFDSLADTVSNLDADVAQLTKDVPNKQDKLVSGTNIKTINGASLLGSGDVTISGGSGTITEVKANGTSVATSGVANIPAASTSAYGVTKLSSATNSTSTSLAATASAVKAAYDLANSYKGTVTGVKINGSTKSPSSGVVDLGTVITSHQDISGKQDKLVSGTNIKTINGTSILGSGDISISAGGGGTITGVSANGTSIATSGVANIPAATTGAYGVTKLNSSTNSTSTTEAATPSAVRAVYGIAGGKQDKLVSGTNIKTINGESILGSGNITISGGGSDSSVFITHFTVSEFVSGNVEFTDEQLEAIKDEARQNKIIALPIASSDGYTGFLVSSYRYYLEDEYGDWGLDLTIIHNGASYNNSMSHSTPYFRLSRLTISPFRPLVEYTSVDESGFAVADSANKDNLIVIIDGECRCLQIGEVGAEYGMTIRFFTGEDCTIEYYGYLVYWANGVIPTIEPYTAYEMSIVYGVDGNPCAVLTPFKPVE